MANAEKDRNVSVPAETYEKLRQFTEHHGMKLRIVVDRAIQDYLKQQPKRGKRLTGL